MKYIALRAVLRHAHKAMKGPWHIVAKGNRSHGITCVVNSAATGKRVGQIDKESADFIAACGNARDDLNAALAELDANDITMEQMEQQLNMVYWERNRLVALLARFFPAGIKIDQNAKEGFQNAIYLETPRGQMSWHIPDDQMVQFAGLPEMVVEWDGHTNEEKYRRMLLLLLDLQAGLDGKKAANG